MTPAEMRTALLTQLDAAPPPGWSVASVWAEPPASARGRRDANLGKHLDGLEGIGFLTLRVGTSTFQVRDTAAHRERFRKRVMASAGFKDNGQKYRSPSSRPLPHTRLTAEEIAEAQT